MSRITEPIYLDNNATTPVDPRVLEAMIPYYKQHFGNAASKGHRFGWLADEAVEAAREQLAAAIHASTKEVVWTSGATESTNLAIKGTAALFSSKGRHIITQVTEHQAVVDPCKHLQHHDFRVTFLPVDRSGQIDVGQLSAALTDETILVSVMLANNEIGTVQPLAEIGRLCKERGVLLHTDATQALGKIPIDVHAMGIDLLSASAHKIYGPKGVGMLYVRRQNPRVRLQALIHGGGHENNMRSGTLNVPGIIAFGKAVELALEQMEEEAARLTGLRDKLLSGLTERLEDIILNGHPTDRLPNTLNVSFSHVDAESLMTAIDPIAVSSGAACSSATKAPSTVLEALGLSRADIEGSIRFSLGRFNTEQEIDHTIERVSASVRKLRTASRKS